MTEMESEKYLYKLILIEIVGVGNTSCLVETIYQIIINSMRALITTQ